MSTEHSQLFNLFHRTALLVLTPQCFDNYFVKFNFLDGPCFSATLSKCLGLAIVAFSVIVKLPQILKIVKSKSGEGISILSVTLDLTAITLYMSYSYLKKFPFSAWGDASFLAVQTVLVGVLVLFYSGKPAKALGYLLVYSGILVLLLGGYVPIEVLWTLQGFNILIVVSGKLVQAYSNYTNGHTGQLSALTLLMLFFGSLARIFTSIQETGDGMVILTYIAGSLANSLLVGQLVYYWNVVPKPVKSQEAKKTKKKAVKAD